MFVGTNFILWVVHEVLITRFLKFIYVKEMQYSQANGESQVSVKDIYSTGKPQ